MHFTIDDNIVTFYAEETIIMYFNIKKQTITLLAVLAPYNRRDILNNNLYLFYNFIEDIHQSQRTYMSYDNMIENVKFVMRYFNISVPKHVRYCMT